MAESTISDTLRRSTRVRVKIQILVTSLDQSAPYSSVCETVIVSAHGCAFRAPQPMQHGTTVRFQLKTGAEATARIVNCRRLNAEQEDWVLGAELGVPSNFWGLDPCPEDWLGYLQSTGRAATTQRSASAAPASAATAAGKMPAWPLTSPARKLSPAAADALAEDVAELRRQASSNRELVAQLEGQLANALGQQLTTAVSERLQPLREEVAGLRKRFEAVQQSAASPVQLPPDLEARLCRQRRDDLEPVLSAVSSLEARIGPMQRQLDTLQAEREQELGSLQSLSQAIEATQAAAAGKISQEVAKLQQQVEELEGKVGSVDPAGPRVDDQVATAVQTIREQVAQERACVESLQEQLRATAQRLDDRVAETRDEILHAAMARQSEEVARVRDQLLDAIAQGQNALLKASREQLLEQVAGIEAKALAKEQSLRVLEEHRERQLADLQQQLRTSLAENQNAHVVELRKELLARVAERQSEATGSLRAELVSALSAQQSQQFVAVMDQLREAVGAELAALKTSQEKCQEAVARVEQARMDSADQISRAVREHAAAHYEDLLGKLREDTVRGARDEITELMERRSTELNAAWGKLKADLEIDVRDLYTQRGRELSALFEDEYKKMESDITQRFEEQQREMHRLREAQMDRVNFEIRERLGPVLAESNSTVNKLQEIITSLNHERSRSEEQAGAARKHRIEFEQWLADQLSGSKAELGSVLGSEITAAVSKAAEQIENVVNDFESVALERARSDFGGEWKSLQERAKALDGEVNRTLTVLQGENRRSQAQIETVHREMEDLAAWLRQRSTDFHKELSDALMDTQDQIKARFHTASEMFERPVQDLCQRVLRDLEEHSSGKIKALQDQVEVARKCLLNTQQAIEVSITGLVTAQLAQTVTSFQDDLRGMRHQISGELRAALAADLISLASVFGKDPGSQPGPESKQKS